MIDVDFSKYLTLRETYQLSDFIKCFFEKILIG